MSTRDLSVPRFPASLGLAAVVVSLGGIVAAIFLAPWFSVFDWALSNLGQRGVATAPVFNLALILGGALGTGFVAYLWTVVDNPIRRGALVLLFFAMVFLALTGVFELPDPMHSVVAPLFFLLMTLGVFVWGAGDWAAGRHLRGGAFVVAAVVHVASWLWWGLFPWFPRGMALPELVGALVLCTWSVWIALQDPGRDLESRSQQ